MSASVSQNLLSILKFAVFFMIAQFVNNVISNTDHHLHSFFLCRKCGREIVQVSNVINVPSDMAISKRNDSLGPADRVMVQLFKNPQGAMFEVITTKEANVFRASEQVSGDTWWPGYNWIILGCPQCHQHVGWEYIPQNKNSDAKAFFGLVLSNLLYENEADELIVLPKSYQS